MGKRGRPCKLDSRVEERREKVTDLLVMGKSTGYIVKVIGDEYDIKRGAVEKDISLCYVGIKKYTTRNLDDVLALHIRRYENVHDKAIEMYDFRSAIAALQAVEKLLRMHVEQPLVAIQHNTLALDGMSTADIMDAITTLKEKNGN